MKRIILCADDYGQNPAISQAIIDLIQKKRLSATSCLVNSANGSQQAEWLLPYLDQIDVGLHLNFTQGKPLSNQFLARYGECHFSLFSLLVRTHLHGLDQKAVRDEIHAQLDLFVAMMGKLPDFIDGHQHVHHLPLIRDALLSVYEERLRNTPLYFRSIEFSRFVSPLRSKYYLKKGILQMTGAKTFSTLLRRQHIPHNTSFSGIYDFGDHYSELFPLFLDEIGEGGLIMCHPGFLIGADKSSDPIYLARSREYGYLSSDNFLQDCAVRDIKIDRFARETFNQNLFTQ